MYALRPTDTDTFFRSATTRTCSSYLSSLIEVSKNKGRSSKCQAEIRGQPRNLPPELVGSQRKEVRDE